MSFNSYQTGVTSAVTADTSGAPDFSGVRVTLFLILCVTFCRSMFVLLPFFFLAIVLSVLRFTVSVWYPQTLLPLSDFSAVRVAFSCLCCVVSIIVCPCSFGHCIVCVYPFGIFQLFFEINQTPQYLYVTATDKKGPDAVLPIFHCDVVKFATSHNKNEHLLTGQIHINELIKSHKTVLITCKCLKIKN